MIQWNKYWKYDVRLYLNEESKYYEENVSCIVGKGGSWPAIFTQPVILHFYAANSRLKVKRHCKGLNTVEWADKETTLISSN